MRDVVCACFLLVVFRITTGPSLLRLLVMMLKLKSVPRVIVPKVMYRNFSLPPDVVYKFHHVTPSHKEIPKNLARNSEDCKSILTVDGESYSLLYESPDVNKSNIYGFVFSTSELKRASDASRLSSNLVDDAKLVPWNMILRRGN